MNIDPIADYLTRVRNAVNAGHRVVDVPASNVKKEITKILFDQGFVLSYKFEVQEYGKHHAKHLAKHLARHLASIWQASGKHPTKHWAIIWQGIWMYI